MSRFLVLGVVPEWHERALCSETDPDVFYPGPGASIQPAKQICARCDVRDECRADAIARAEPWGVWGGMSETERKRIVSLARIREARLLREAGESC